MDEDDLPRRRGDAADQLSRESLDTYSQDELDAYLAKRFNPALKVLQLPDAAPKAIFAELINLLRVVTAGVHTCSQNIQPSPVAASPYLFQVRIEALPGFLSLQIAINDVMRN